MKQMGVLSLLAATVAVAQNPVIRTGTTGVVDLSTASATQPARKGSGTPPGPCIQGEQYFRTDAAPGQNLYFCTATNTWTQMAVAAGGGITSMGGQTGAVQIFASDTNVTMSSAANTHTLGWNGTLPASRGGTGQGAFINGDLLYASGAAALSRLAVGGNGQCLIVSAGLPVWGSCPIDPSVATKNNPNTFSAGAKQIFQPSSTTAGVAVAAAALPTTPAAGDLAIDSADGNSFKHFDGAAWRKVAVAAATLTGGEILQGNGSNQVATAVSTGSGNVVRANSPTLTTPAIASFTSANHDHSSTAGGGGIANAALPNAFDVSGKTSTKSVKSGTVTPGTCTVGELFYDTDATPGQNLYGCTSANVWTLLGDGVGGAGTLTVQNNGTAVASRPVINFIPGTGIGSPMVISDNAGQNRVDITINADSAYLNSAYAQLSAANTYRAGFKQSVLHDGTNAGFRFIGAAGDPGTLADGDCWYNSTTGKLRCRENGTSKDIIGSGSSSAPRQAIFIVGAENGSALTDADDQPSIFVNRLGADVTVTEVWCECDSGSPVINLQRDDGTPSNILSSNLTCLPAGATGVIDGAEAAIANGERIDFTLVIAGAAKRVTVSIRYTAN